MRRFLIALLLPLALAACGADNRWASDEAVRNARFVANEPPSITLFTIVGIPRGDGAHTAMMINGSQRVIFDPAGTWNHPSAPERHDVIYGITPNFKNFFVDYHARETYYVIEDRIEVPLATANAAIRAAEAQGAVNKAFCTQGTSSVLSQTPGFEDVPRTFFPKALREWFIKHPGVVSKEHRDGDPDNNHDVLLRQRDGTVQRAGGKPVG